LLGQYKTIVAFDERLLFQIMQILFNETGCVKINFIWEKLLSTSFT